MCICVACIVSKKNCSGVVKQAGKKFTPKKKKKIILLLQSGRD